MLAAVLNATEKKRIIWPSLPSKFVKFSVLLIKLNFFVVDPSWSESTFILFLFFYSIRVDPTRTGGPSWSGPTFQPALILALLFIRKLAWPAHSSATQAIKINTLDQITGKVIDVSRTHIPLKALMIPLKRVKLRGVV